MSDHAPGPWRIERLTQRKIYQRYDLTIVSGHSGSVATLYAENWSIGGQKDLANARLIAAAPDLLEACRLAAAPDLLEACRLALNAWEKNWAIDWDDVRRAIAKTEDG